jgi:hypothetical protein
MFAFVDDYEEKDGQRVSKYHQDRSEADSPSPVGLTNRELRSRRNQVTRITSASQSRNTAKLQISLSFANSDGQPSWLNRTH